MHTDAQSHTAPFKYVAVYMYSISIVCSVDSDAVLCMLTCRWNMTIIHRGGCAGGQRTDSLAKLSLSALHLPNFDLSKLTVNTTEKSLFRSSFPLRGVRSAQRFQPSEGTHNLAFNVRRNLAAASVGRRREEGRQTGALQLSGSAQSGTGHPASNCLFILRQRDLHISMSVRAAREVREQGGERAEKKESEGKE